MYKISETTIIPRDVVRAYLGEGCKLIEHVRQNDIYTGEAPKLGELHPSSTPQFRRP